MEKELKLVVKSDIGKEFTIKLQKAENLGETELICESRCPYGKIGCDSYPDPRYPRNSNSNFENFCGELGEIENPGYINTFPVPGSLESIFIEEAKL